MQPVLGDQARLRTRYLYQCILQRASWNAKVLVSTDAFEECIFWEHKVESFNEIGSRLSQLTYNVPQDYYVFSDASGTSFGGFVTTGSEDEPLEMFGSWSMAEQAESSTWRELEAVKRLLINFVNILSGKTIRVFTDNLNITHILNIGSRKMVLHKNALFVDEFCRENAIKLSLVWLPRESNQYADTLSRVTDSDDWEIQDEIFLYLNHVWGPHDIDRFAHDYNAKCKHFNSKFWCPGTAGIDSFYIRITLDNTVKEAVQDSGIEVGSYMYELYPKMCELLINSKSDNTVKSYFNSYKRWERFITLQGHKSLPAQPVHVALYLTHLLNNNSTCHPISNAVYGIKWAHEINGLNDPTSNTFVTSILEASKRVAPKKTEKKDSITPETLIELCDMFKNSLDLLVIRIWQ
ncbi:Hypothetical predicted protein [Mytilus galloprovincialis]|uniref:RNase H type-1 domain-containing protein n=1 Tax=Mytilus galloprovincialis TaxID=29158 RepID=A0A8B6HID5_MYTGA|nr:Hypothetical predicted protein [Mytilus galloprovincialis]